MATVKVKVLQLRGETGLRQPGSSYFLADTTASEYQKLGYVVIEKQGPAKVEKELKPERIETKELKNGKKETKKKK